MYRDKQLTADLVDTSKERENGVIAYKVKF